MRIDEDKRVKVEPVNRVTTNTGEYEYPYTYTGIHADEYVRERMGKVEPNPATVEENTSGGGFYYKYLNGPTILVTNNGVYASTDVSRTEAENQAYFILSIMSSEGYVSGFEKQ